MLIGEEVAISSVGL